jgi:rod shape-determining protein MreC
MKMVPEPASRRDSAGNHDFGRGIYAQRSGECRERKRRRARSSGDDWRRLIRRGVRGWGAGFPILLIIDLNLRVPVIIERFRRRAILVGDNSDYSLLWYLDPAGPLNVGDRVVTSGAGGVFPPGVPVGVVIRADHGTLRVAPFVRCSEAEFPSRRRFWLGQRLASRCYSRFRGR